MCLPRFLSDRGAPEVLQVVDVEGQQIAGVGAVRRFGAETEDDDLSVTVTYLRRNDARIDLQHERDVAVAVEQDLPRSQAHASTLQKRLR